MVEVHAPNDCGNAPRKGFLKEFNRAFAEGDVDFLRECVSDDVVWEIVGEETLRGREAFIEALEAMASKQAVRLILHHVITHGKEAAAHGELHFVDGEIAHFCDVYEFRGAKGTTLKYIRSFVVTS